MNWKYAGLIGLFALSVDATMPTAADACGVKLGLKAGRPRKGPAKTARPSQLLLVGSPPKRLQDDLTKAGHQVEVAPTPAAGKRPGYDIVMVSNNEEAAEAHQKYPNAAVVMRSNDLVADVRSVETEAKKRPVAAGEGRVVIAAGPDKQPSAAKTGGGNVVAAKSTDQVVAAKDNKPEEVTAPPPAAGTTTIAAKQEPTEPAKPEPTKPEKVTTTAPTHTETADSKPAPTVKETVLDSEIYFSSNSADVKDTNRLDKAVKWLTAHADVTAVIEGHADPRGNPDANMTLSQSRADAVKDYLTSKGIDGSRLEVKAFGDTQLRYGHGDGRNRRVRIQPQK